jgi:hypothetical protein
MNLVSGLEETPGYFWVVTGASVTWAFLVYCALAAINSWPLYAAQRRLADMTAVQDVLMYNIDVIGEVCVFCLCWTCFLAPNVVHMLLTGPQYKQTNNKGRDAVRLLAPFLSNHPNDTHLKIALIDRRDPCPPW